MSRDVLEAVTAALDVLEPLDAEGRERALRWLAESLGVETADSGLAPPPPPAPATVPTPARSPATPIPGAPPSNVKDFLLEKNPGNKGQQLAVLAYYKTHYEGSETFTTQELVELNVAAGGQRISNPSRDMDNATRSAGLFTTVSGRTKKLSALGELVVNALPDQSAAREIMKERRPKKRAAKKSASKSAKRAKKR